MAAMSAKPPATVAEYIARAPKPHRAALRQLRADIRAAAPEAEEVISYQMPAYRRGKMLVYFAAFKAHCTFFFLSRAARKKYARELSGYELVQSEAGLKFDPAKPLPSGLVRKLVRARLAEVGAAGAKAGPKREPAKTRKAKARRAKPKGSKR